MNPDRPTRIPTREELLSDFSEKAPQRDPGLVYLGMTRDEIAEGIRQSPTVLPHYLGRMGEYGFAYYFPAFASYLHSEDARGDAWNLLMLHNIVSFRLDVMKSNFPDCREEVVGSVQYCASNIEKFKVNALLNQGADTERDYETEIEAEFNLLLHRLSDEPAAGKADQAKASEPPGLYAISPTLGLDLDERSAIQSFYGKSLDEAQAMFRDHPSRYTLELPWMGRDGFRYYFAAYAAHLKSPEVAVSPEDFEELESVLGVHCSGDFTEWRTDGTVLDLIDYGIQLLWRPRHARNYENIKLRQSLEKLKVKIKG